MRRIQYTLLLLPAAVLLTLAFCFRTDNQNEPLLSQSVVNVLENHHYEPKKINDNYSRELFRTYLKRLDAEKRFFLQHDIDTLKKFETGLDDQARQGTFEFFDRANALHLIRVHEIESMYREILAGRFDFTAEEYFEFDEENASYLKSKEELKAFWTKNLKYQVLQRLARKMDVQEKAAARKDTALVIKSEDSLEAESRREVLRSHDEWFSRLKKFDRNDKLSMYINCMTEIFDPHTNYLPVQDKQNFDIRMSGKLEGIGAQLQEKDGLLKVVSIVPGSPSYKQGQLKAGDIIMKVAQGSEEPVDVTNMKIDDAIQLIRGKKGTEVRLTVKKPDETIVVIPIVRDVVVMEDSYAKSAVIEKDGKKYGYINLPSFYVDMNDRNGRSCSKDVAAEIEKLKKDNVKGIMLDLRNNGGGSLGDVVDMVGLFIERGPVTMVRPRSGRTEMLGDPDGKILWKGPLAIMVNESSASASEIMAAALQDYGRAVVVGTPTFGKGTVQKFIDLDDAFSTRISDRLGSVKITIQKFYRINGTTTQLVGVTPDIILPDRYRYLEFGEKENEFSLEADKITPAFYETFGQWTRPIEKAKERSAKRVAEDSLFSEIEKAAKRIQAQNKRTRFTLQLQAYREEIKQMELLNKKLEELSAKVTPMKIYDNSEDKSSFQDDMKRRIKSDWNKTFEKDVYIRETVEILKDLD